MSSRILNIEKIFSKNVNNYNDNYIDNDITIGRNKNIQNSKKEFFGKNISVAIKNK